MIRLIGNTREYFFVPRYINSFSLIVFSAKTTASKANKLRPFLQALRYETAIGA